MLKSNYRNNLITNSLIDLGDDIAVEGKGKGRKFVSRFIEPGVAHYEEFGDVLITKETLDKFIQTMVGCPVIIKHKDIDDKNVDKERVGVVSKVWYNEADGWFYCEGIIWDKQAIDLVKNQGWNVSCTYDFDSDKQSKLHNGKKIDMEFVGGEFLHLALVPNPRYERANIVMNSKAENEEHWITIGSDEDHKGRHILVKDGETNKEATERKVAEWEGKETKSTKKDEDRHQKVRDLEDKAYKEFKTLHDNYIQGDVKISDFGKATEKFNKKYKEEFDKLESDRFVSFEDLAKRENKQSDTKDKSEGEEKKERTRIVYKEDKDFDGGITGIFEDEHGEYQALTPTVSKTFKTIKGAEKFLESRGFKKPQDKGEGKEPKKYNYTLTKREVEDRKMLGGMADTGNYYTNGDFAIDKKYMNVKGQEPTKKEELEKSLKSILKGDSTYRYTPVKDFEIGELKREYGKPIKVAKYSYFDEKNGYEHNIYINKKYNDLFKNFDLKFGGETEPVFAYKGKDIVGVVMPILGRDQNYTKVENEIDEELESSKDQISLFKADNSIDSIITNALAEVIVENCLGE